MRFVFLKPALSAAEGSPVCVQLPPDLTSRWRPCLPLPVGAIRLRRP